MKTTTPPPQNCPNNGIRKFSLMRLNTAKLFPSPVTNYFRSSGRKQHNTEQGRATQRQRIDPEPWDKSFAFPQNAWKRLLTSVPPCLTPLSGVCCSGQWKKNEANKCFWKHQFLKANLLRWGLSTIKHKTPASQLETKCQTFTQSTSPRLFPPSQQRIQRNRSYINRSEAMPCSAMKFLGTKGLHIYSTPPSLSISQSHGRSAAYPSDCHVQPGMQKVWQQQKGEGRC